LYALTFLSHFSFSFPDQADQTHQAAAGRERGASLHQSAADAQGNDDKGPGLWGEGTIPSALLFFHHLLVVRTRESATHQMKHVTDISGYSVPVSHCTEPTRRHEIGKRRGGATGACTRSTINKKDPYTLEITASRVVYEFFGKL